MGKRVRRKENDWTCCATNGAMFHNPRKKRRGITLKGTLAERVRAEKQLATPSGERPGLAGGEGGGEAKLPCAAGRGIKNRGTSPFSRGKFLWEGGGEHPQRFRKKAPLGKTRAREGRLKPIPNWSRARGGHRKRPRVKAFRGGKPLGGKKKLS